jgi:cell wall-associated NlpC family hydrolase
MRQDEQRQRRGNGPLWVVAIIALLVAANAKPQQATGTSSHKGRQHAAPAVSPSAAKAVAYARSQLGKPYVWGAEGPGAFDCSGLTWASWRAAGLGWGRMTAADQWQTLRRHEVTRAQLRPGDLVFFAWRAGDWRSIHHVGLYVGAGRMAEAPYSGATVRLASINRSGWFGAARPTGGR